jgi:fatty-acyl-CoA synthase
MAGYGDLALMRPDGYFKITGRARDMIIRGGENVYPREIEEFLYTHPAIADAACHKIPEHIRFVESYPMTLSGKVQKFKMREFEISTRGLEAVANRQTV